MSLRKLVLNLLVVCLSLIGLGCGFVCVVCLLAYMFWHGLGPGSAALAVLCLSCLGLAAMLSGQAAKGESKRLRGTGLRSLKTRWRARGAGSQPAPYVDREAAAYRMSSDGLSATQPVESNQDWPEDPVL